MRIVDCNVCGESPSAADDEDLLKRLREHVSSAHESASFEESQAREAIENEAYDASDS